MQKSLNLAFILRFIALSLVMGFFAVVTSAQCNPETEAALYQRFLDTYKGTVEQQKTANDLGKDYLAKFGDCPSTEEKKITEFVKKWLAKYEADLIDRNCTNAVNNLPTKAFDLCGPLLAKDPESLRTHLLLSLAGLKNLSANDTKSNDQTLGEMKKVLGLISSGRTVDTWIVAGSKDETIGNLQYYSGLLTVNSAPGDAIAALTKAAQSDSSYSKNPSTYLQLGRAIFNDQVKKLSDEYDSKCANRDPSEECTQMLGQLYRGLDRVIDAYARSVALGRTNPGYKKLADSVNAQLTDIYMKRHDDSTVGLDQLVSDILSKPLP